MKYDILNYQIVCSVLKHYGDTENYFVKSTTESIAKSLAVLFEQENSSFNKDRFLKECGI